MSLEVEDMNRRLLQFVLFALLISVHGEARASFSSYMNFEGVAGESNPPGAPGSIAIDSLGLGSATAEITKPVDSTSSAIAQAEGSGTPFSSATVLFYDDPNTASAPDASLVLNQVLVSGIQTVTLGSRLSENVSLVYATPSVSMFLELPGVTGESSAPGFSGLIAVQSVSLSSNGFSVVKALDSTSTALSLAALNANPFATASLLFYTNILGETHPDFSLVYQQALVSQIVTASGGERPTESVTFVAANSTVGHPVPEPGAETELLAAVLVGAAVTRMPRSREPK
jgi:type VI protein secretion system component Hcp